MIINKSKMNIKLSIANAIQNTNDELVVWKSVFFLSFYLIRYVKDIPYHTIPCPRDMRRRECKLTSVQLPLHSSPLPHMLYQHTSNDYKEHSANQHRDHQERCLPVQHVVLIIHGVLKGKKRYVFYCYLLLTWLIIRVGRFCTLCTYLNCFKWWIYYS